MLTTQYNVISVMSGTSLDGIDLLYAKFIYSGQWEFKIIESATMTYSLKWKKILSSLTQRSISELKQIDYKYSEYLAQKILDFINSKKIKAIDFIASHGHTALHNPNAGYTYQIGNQQILADELNIKVICDFRTQDVKLGGQGAPLVPIGDRLLFSEYFYCINLGGFANISFEDKSERMAYDICPVNIVLNKYAKTLGFDFDRNGDIARSGKVYQPFLDQLNALEYYNQNPPKSLGLEWVESHVFQWVSTFELSVEDILRTYTEHIAVQISKELKVIDSTVLVTGGGAYNSFLIERLKKHSRNEIILPSKEIIEFKEAIIFGLLGVLRERKAINILSSVTGASEDHSSGKILLPEN